MKSPITRSTLFIVQRDYPDINTLSLLKIITVRRYPLMQVPGCGNIAHSSHTQNRLSSRVYNTVLHVIHGTKVHSCDSTAITFRHRAAEISNIIMPCLGENGAERQDTHV